MGKNKKTPSAGRLDREFFSLLSRMPKKGCHENAYCRQADVRKGDLFENIALPPKCQQEEEKCGTDQIDWKMDKEGCCGGRPIKR
jgi:hypothetical protein